MIADIEYREKRYRVDLSRPLDISVAVRPGPDHVAAWHVGPPRMEPVRRGDWVGAVAQGAPVNFFDICFNPHGHGTHTECVGHITRDPVSVNAQVRRFFTTARLVTMTPEQIENGDRVITREQVAAGWKTGFAEALVLRTLPNDASKLSRKYTGTNPAYLHHEAAQWMCDRDIRHLLLDLPSVDREDDGGKLLAHHAFWHYPERPRMDCTITELIYVSPDIVDGDYFLDLHIAPFENDASPSRPVLYGIR